MWKLIVYFIIHFHRDLKPLSLGERHGKELKFQLVTWSPEGHSLVIVHQGDIYYKENPNDTSAHRITDSAQPGIIYNGVPDWLYEGKQTTPPQRHSVFNVSQSNS